MTIVAFPHDDQVHPLLLASKKQIKVIIIYLDKPVDKDSPHVLIDVELMGHVIWRNTA